MQITVHIKSLTPNLFPCMLNNSLVILNDDDFSDCLKEDN